MTNESVALVVNKLEGLAQSIGIGVQDMFPYFVKQQYIDSIAALLPFICLMAVFPLFLHFRAKTDWDANDSSFIICYHS